MRREGFELAVSSPEVVFKEIDGQICEPMEYIILDIDSDFQGLVFELIGKRSVKLENMVSEGSDHLRLEYIVPSRTLIGFKNEFLTAIKGTGIIYHSFYGYLPKADISSLRGNGVFITMAPGKTAAYALHNLEDGVCRCRRRSL